MKNKCLRLQTFEIPDLWQMMGVTAFALRERQYVSPFVGLMLDEN